MNKKLNEWITQYKTFSEAAYQIGVSRFTIAKWARGDREPSLMNALKIEKNSNGEFKAEEIRPDLFK